MKLLLLSAVVLVMAVSAACSGPGGPGQRAGRAVDRGIYNVGAGVERTGQAIENVAR